MKCIIVDDEPIARKGMKRLIDSHPNLHLEAALDSGEGAVQWLSAHDVDLVFLDIEMPGMSGLELASVLPAKSMVIFTTAYPDYAIDSYDVDAIGYLVKPISKERFDRAVNRAIAHRELIDSAAKTDEASDGHDFIIVKSGRKYVRIKLHDVLYLEGLKDYVIIRLTERRIVTRMLVKQMEDLLPKNMFLRVSRSYIVNKERIDAFDSNDITVGATEIPIGATYRDSVMAALLKK